jgi:hypothetical protein
MSTVYTDVWSGPNDYASIRADKRLLMVEDARRLDAFLQMS